MERCCHHSSSTLSALTWPPRTVLDALRHLHEHEIDSLTDLLVLVALCTDIVESTTLPNDISFVTIKLLIL